MDGDWSRDFSRWEVRQVEEWDIPTKGLCKSQTRGIERKARPERLERLERHKSREGKKKEKGDDGGGELWRNERSFPMSSAKASVFSGSTSRDVMKRHWDPL
jgi:hypothetical protein